MTSNDDHLRHPKSMVRLSAKCFQLFRHPPPLRDEESWLGRVIAARNFPAGSTSLELGIGDWKPGLYLLKIKQDGKITVKKLVVNR